MPPAASWKDAWPAARPLVKWTGGKTGELEAIRAAMPDTVVRHIEPFVGGGAVLFAMPPDVPAAANDRSADLISLYRCQAVLDDRFMGAVHAIETSWTGLDALDLTGGDATLAHEAGRAASALSGILGQRFPLEVAAAAAAALARKRRFLTKLEEEGEAAKEPESLVLAAIKGGLYTAIRAGFNRAEPGPGRAALFWFLREFCYGGMFRTNAQGAFNVPYGGISYSQRSMAARIAQLTEPMTRARLEATRLHCGDFDAFLDAVRPGSEDFIFLDPPYDSPFSTYDGNSFGRADHRRLAARLAATEAKWMLVISETPFVRECYAAIPGVRVFAFGKLYKGNIKGRVDGRAVHLLITNYDWR